RTELRNPRVPPLDNRRTVSREIERVRQRHMKTEFVEHVWVSPFDEQRTLPLSERRGKAPFEIRRRGLRSQRRERAQRIRSEFAHARVALVVGRSQCDEIAEGRRFDG